MTEVTIEAPPGFQALLRRLTTIPDPVRRQMESALAEELITLEEDLRGPTKDSPGGGPPSGPHGLSPGLGLVPINTGRLLQSFNAVPSGLSATMTMDAQDPRSGFFYGEVAHFAGGEDGETVTLATERWEVMAERATAAMEVVLSGHLAG